MATTAATIPFAHQHAHTIPKLTHDEAGQLATTELTRVLTLVESLSGDDWTQPTDCTEWTVRDMVAHLAGSCAASASWAEFFRQVVRNPYVRSAAAPVDGINRRQIEDRVGRTPAEIVAELRDVGPRAVQSRQRLPWFVRHMRVPFGPPLGVAPVSYLMDNIYTRDQWMHRADICRATGRSMHLTPDHDARVVALVLRDLEQQLRRMPGRATVDLTLTGTVDLHYRFGDNPEADSAIGMDLVEFNRLASGRITPDEAAALAAISGDPARARWFLENSSVPF